MYSWNDTDEYAIEDICYEEDHINKVMDSIKRNFDEYFERFIKTDAGHIADELRISLISNGLSIPVPTVKSKLSIPENYRSIVIETINEFERDREKYLAIFDEEALEEYEVDPSYFKSTVLKKECPIIHKTLFSNEKVLDKYKRDFSIADSNVLYNVLKNLSEFAREYHQSEYDEASYDNITEVFEYGVSDLDMEDYSVQGVIGGGIRSHLLYKNYPDVFPNRSRRAIWAFWYLTDKKKFGCSQDSEFLMIDTKKTITQQNYFYPYDLFTFYTHQVFLLLKEKADAYGVDLNLNYRYVLVDAFLTFIASEHEDEISLLSKQIKEGHAGVAYA